MKPKLPGGVKGGFTAAGGALKAANDLKNKKDELQISMFETAINPVWKQFDR